MILFSDDSTTNITKNETNNSSSDPEKKEEGGVAPLSFLPVELVTIVFPIIRIVYNIIYFIEVFPRIFNGQYGDYLWIGHIIEFILVTVAFFLHTTRLYTHWDSIYGISKENPRWTFLFTLSISSWAICTYLYFYFGTNGLYQIFGQHHYIFCVIILTFFTSFTQVVSYYVFAQLMVQKELGEIDWVRWWVDKPLLTFNLTVQIFLILEKNIWVNVWIGDFIYHIAEYVFAIMNWCKKRMNEDESALKSHQTENGQSGMIDMVPYSSSASSLQTTDVVV